MAPRLHRGNCCYPPVIAPPYTKCWLVDLGGGRDVIKNTVLWLVDVPVCQCCQSTTSTSNLTFMIVQNVQCWYHPSYLAPSIQLYCVCQCSVIRCVYVCVGGFESVCVGVFLCVLPVLWGPKICLQNPSYLTWKRAVSVEAYVGENMFWVRLRFRLS